MWFRSPPHFLSVSVNCRLGHCGLAVVSVYLFYRSLAFGVGLGVVVGGGFVLSYRSFALVVGFGRSAFAVVSYFLRCLSFASGVGFGRSAPTLPREPTPRTWPKTKPLRTAPDQKRNHRERDRTKRNHREPTNRSPPERGCLSLGWAVSFP